MAKAEGDKKRKKKSKRAGEVSPDEGNLKRGTETGAGAGGAASGDIYDWNQEAAERTDEDEFGNPPDPKLKNIGSKQGFITSSERDHATGGDSYEHTGSENREGMGSGTQAGPAHQGYSKPQREHGHGSEPPSGEE